MPFYPTFSHIVDNFYPPAGGTPGGKSWTKASNKQDNFVFLTSRLQVNQHDSMADQKGKSDRTPITVRQLFRDKNPRLARFIPGFVYRYLHRILHLDFVNEILRLHGDKRDLEFVKSAIDMFHVTVDVRGIEHLPDRGRFIFASNHPLGGFDGALLIRELGEKYDGVKVLVNDILLNINNMDGIFVPINKHGAQVMKNVRMMDEIYRSDSQILTFPSGLVSRRRNGVIKDPPWHKNFVKKAVSYKRDVIPVHVTGRCSNFFYNLANLRKFLGIKSNLEMFYLPDETFKHRNKKYTITFGKPVKWQTFDRTLKHTEWAAELRDHVYELAEDPGAEFNENQEKTTG